MLVGQNPAEDEQTSRGNEPLVPRHELEMGAAQEIGHDQMKGLTGGQRLRALESERDGIGAPVLLGLNALRPFRLRFDPIHRLIEITPGTQPRGRD